MADVIKTVSIAELEKTEPTENTNIVVEEAGNAKKIPIEKILEEVDKNGISGNAETATKLKTPVLINNAEFDGTSNIAVQPLLIALNEDEIWGSSEKEASSETKFIYMPSDYADSSFTTPGIQFEVMDSNGNGLGNMQLLIFSPWVDKNGIDLHFADICLKINMGTLSKTISLIGNGSHNRLMLNFPEGESSGDYLYNPSPINLEYDGDKTFDITPRTIGAAEKDHTHPVPTKYRNESLDIKTGIKRFSDDGVSAPNDLIEIIPPRIIVRDGYNYNVITNMGMLIFQLTLYDNKNKNFHGTYEFIIKKRVDSSYNYDFDAYLLTGSDILLDSRVTVYSRTYTFTPEGEQLPVTVNHPGIMIYTPGINLNTVTAFVHDIIFEKSYKSVYPNSAIYDNETSDGSNHNADLLNNEWIIKTDVKGSSVSINSKVKTPPTRTKLISIDTQSFSDGRFYASTGDGTRKLDTSGEGANFEIKIHGANTEVYAWEDGISIRGPWFGSDMKLYNVSGMPIKKLYGGMKLLCYCTSLSSDNNTYAIYDCVKYTDCV